MLNDAERTQLRRIEQRLAQQDAEFVNRLRQRVANLPTTSVAPVDLTALGETARYIAVTLVLLLLAGGLPAGALGICLLSVAAHRCWATPAASKLRRRRRRGRRDIDRD